MKVIEHHRANPKPTAVAAATATTATSRGSAAASSGSVTGGGSLLEQYRNLFYSCVSTLHANGKIVAKEAAHLRSLFEAKDDMVSAAVEVYSVIICCCHPLRLCEADAVFAIDLCAAVLLCCCAALLLCCSVG